MHKINGIHNEIQQRMNVDMTTIAMNVSVTESDSVTLDIQTNECRIHNEGGGRGGKNKIRGSRRILNAHIKNSL